MNYFLVLLVCFVVASNCERTAEEKNLFRQWHRLHNKRYSSHEKELEALEIFLKNKAEIDAHNKLYEQGKISYRRSLASHCDLSDEDFKIQRLGGLEPQDNRRKRRAGPPPQVPEGPKEVDWVKEGLVADPMNQDSCGDCWAFSATGLVEAAVRKSNPGSKIKVSEQNLEDCSYNLGCGNKTHSGGGWTITGLKYVKENGIASEEEYPYYSYDRPCEYNKSMEVAKIKEAHDIDIGGDENVMKNIVAKFGPVAIGICVDSKFQSLGPDDIYDNADCCKDKLGLHAPLVVGYGANEKGVAYWLVKNSWGPSWGKNGFGRIARGVNICGIADRAIQYATA